MYVGGHPSLRELAALAALEFAWYAHRRISASWPRLYVLAMVVCVMYVSPLAPVQGQPSKALRSQGAAPDSRSYSLLLKDDGHTWCAYQDSEEFKAVAAASRLTESVRATCQSGALSELIWQVEAESGDLVIVDQYTPANAQNCKLAAAPAWSPELKTILADCDNRLAAPGGQLILRIDANGTVRVQRPASDELVARASRVVEPPAMAAWSPTSDAFFINDGNGSGETSELRVYTLKDRKITESDRVQRNAAHVYRSRIGCASSALDPDVWGIRWTPDGRYLDLLVQATVHQPCGEVGSFLGMRVRVSDAKVVEVLSESATVAGWSAWLPKGLKPREKTPTH